jgi:alkanesulfonate monooxygenase SsuD/methylene tetrahydromethanopterin reductase-like flavin-dependent oxidoreductase (luciferase family)
MSLAVFSAGDNAMTWLGVGNVEGVMLHPPSRVPPRQESLLLRPGVLGIRLPRLSASVLQVSAGDLLIFATDGLREGFEAHTNLRDSPQQIADRILDQYGRGTDDALVLVARYLHGKADVTVR